jgi:hypothetical protein
VLFAVQFVVQFAVFLAVRFQVSFRVAFGLAVLVTVFGRRLGGQRFIMHFVGEGVGFFRRVFVIVLVILIGIQSFLQFFHFGWFHVRFGHGFDGFGALFGIGLGFFVLGFGELLGERGDVFVGKVRDMRVGDRCRTRLGIERIKVACDFTFRVGRSVRILGRGGGCVVTQIRNWGYVFFGNRDGRAYVERSRQACGQFLVRKSA